MSWARTEDRREVAALVGANAALVVLCALGAPLVPLAILLVGGVVAVIGSRPQRGILLLVALVPFDGLLLLVPHPGIVDGWKEALALGCLIATFVAPAEARAHGRRSLPSWVGPVALLLGLSLVSALAYGGLTSLLGLKIGFFYLSIAWAAWRCPFDARERDLLVTILLAGGIVTATFGLLQQVLGAERLVAMGYEYNTAVRFSGSFLRSFSTFVQPFGFGFYLMVVVLMTLPGALREPGRLRSRIVFWTLPLLTLGILSTIVRGAWLGLAVGVVYLAATRHRSLVLLVPVAVVAVLLLPPDAASSALSSSSTSERTAGWSENVHHVLANPFGAGVGSTGAGAEKAAELERSKSATYQPDNQFFLSLYELGPLGLWAQILLVLGAFRAARLAARTRTGRDGDLAAGVAAVVVGATFASLVATFFQIFPMDVLWWVLLMAVATMSAEDPEPAADRPLEVPAP